MKTFRLEIQSSVSLSEVFDNVISFTGRDSSGSFSVLAMAEKRITVLSFGLASFKLDDGHEEYLALPGGVLDFRDNKLVIATRTYVRDRNFSKITTALETEIRKSENELTETKRSLQRLDQEILKRLSRMSWRTEA